MKKRWLSLYVENNRGVLAKIAGLFAGKAYNLESLTVGTTEDETVSRITICLKGDDETFEQIKKQLNRLVEIIKVIDLTGIEIHTSEILYIKLKNCSKEEKEEVFRMAQVYKLDPVQYNMEDIVLESVNTDKKNNEIIDKFRIFKNMEIVRGGSVAIEL